MTKRAGSADLPLHGGRVPPWLAQRMGWDEELAALKHLDVQARQLEHKATGLTLERLIQKEFEDSNVLGGRSVFGWESAMADSKRA